MQLKSRIDAKATSALLRKHWQASRRAQTAVAVELKISQSQLSRLLAGRFSRESAGLRRLCAYLDAKCIYKAGAFSLRSYPAMHRCLADLMDGSRRRERAIIRLLRSARGLVAE